MTTWWRPLRAALRAQGLATPDGGWRRTSAGAYREVKKRTSGATFTHS
jgi:hypothetical protein